MSEVKKRSSVVVFSCLFGVFCVCVCVCVGFFFFLLLLNSALAQRVTKLHDTYTCKNVILIHMQ